MDKTTTINEGLNKRKNECMDEWMNECTNL